MGFFERWVGRPIKLTDGEFWRGFFGLGTTSGETVTIESALSLDAVWASPPPPETPRVDGADLAAEMIGRYL